MATYTVPVTDLGIYEIPLAANTEAIITFTPRPQDLYPSVPSRYRVMVHTSTNPVYAGLATITAKAGIATVCPSGKWVTLTARTPTDVHVITAGTATVSITRYDP